MKDVVLDPQARLMPPRARKRVAKIVTWTSVHENLYISTFPNCAASYLGSCLSRGQAAFSSS